MQVCCNSRQNINIFIRNPSIIVNTYFTQTHITVISHSKSVQGC